MRITAFVFATISILTVTRVARAETLPEYCTGAPDAAGIAVRREGLIAAPMVSLTADHFIAVTGASATPIDVGTPIPTKWDATLLDTLRAAQPSGGHVEIDLVFKAPPTAGANAGAATLCRQKLSLPSVELPKPEKPDTGLKSSFDDCRTAGSNWEAEVTAQSNAGHHTLIVFSQGGEICYANRLQGVMGDPIYVGIYADPAVTWTAMQFSPCSLEDASPAIFSGGDVSLTSKDPNGRASGEAWGMIRTAPRTCYNDHVDIKIDGSAGNTKYNAGLSLQQYTVYRATLQLGVLFSTRHTATFDLAGDASGGSTIHFSGDSGKGPEYVAALVLYGFPNYFVHLFDGGPAYRGRDLINDQGLVDRLGLIAGVGLTDPTRRFVLGASFEVMYGLNVMIVDDFHRQLQLDGVMVGDQFMETADKIPTKNSWEHEFVFGISLDLRYVKELFGGHVKP